MEEQHLTMFQRNKVNYHLRNGDPLPPPRKPKFERAQDYEDQLAMEIMMRAKTARKRSLDVIQASGAFEVEKYVIYIKNTFTKTMYVSFADTSQFTICANRPKNKKSASKNE